MNLDEIVKQISSRTGLDEAKSKQAIAIVLDNIKSNLPDGIASQMEEVLAGKGFSYSEFLKSNLSDWKDKAEDKLDDLKDDAAGFIKKIF